MTATALLSLCNHRCDRLRSTVCYIPLIPPVRSHAIRTAWGGARFRGRTGRRYQHGAQGSTRPWPLPADFSFSGESDMAATRLCTEL
jgi:hypothetical protein